MNPEGEMCVEYYNYRVEFQMRGAGHIHGTLWIDWEQMKKHMERRKDNSFKVELVEKAFTNIKDEKFGTKEHKKEFEIPKENGHTSEFNEEHDALAAFIDKFCTCSLKDPRTRDIVRSVNMHNHTKSCKKFMIDCRFWYPRFPSLRTIISTPAEILYSDPDEAAKALQEATAFLKKVKDILENKDEMADLCKKHEDKIEKYINHKNIVMKVKDIIEEVSTGVFFHWENLDEKILFEYCSYFGKLTDKKQLIDLENLKVLQQSHHEEMNKIDMDEILEERLISLLDKAKIEGENYKEKIGNYEKALSIAPKRYSVVVKSM